MKKLKIFYGIIIFLSIIMIFIPKFYCLINIYSYNDADIGIIDGFQGNVFLSIINCLIVILSLISTIIVTCSKNNKINKKWLLCVGIIILQLCIPIGIEHYSGGIAGRMGEKNIYLWNAIR